MRITLLPSAALLAALSLAACDVKPTTINAAGPVDPNANAVAAAEASGNIHLPPAVKSSAAYRCKDNTLVYVDLFQGDMLAHFRAIKGGTATVLSAEKAGDPLMADGYQLTGDAKSITLKQPGKASQTCKAS